MIIFAGIVAELPAAIGRANALNSAVRARCRRSLIVCAVLSDGDPAVIAFIVFMERAQRRLLIQYPKRQVGNRMFEGRDLAFALEAQYRRRHSADFCVVITAAADHVGTVWRKRRGQPAWLADLDHDHVWTWPTGLSDLLRYDDHLFAFFYTSIVFNPKDTADNLRKYGGFIPGIRPGDRTAEYIDFVLTRITCVGALYLAFVCVIPEMLRSYGGIQSVYLGGTSLLIVVSVTMDTVAQVQSHLLAHQYEGLIKKSKLRGSRGGKGR